MRLSCAENAARTFSAHRPRREATLRRFCRGFPAHSTIWQAVQHRTYGLTDQRPAQIRLFGLEGFLPTSPTYRVICTCLRFTCKTSGSRVRIEEAPTRPLAIVFKFYCFSFRFSKEARRVQLSLQPAAASLFEHFHASESFTDFRRSKITQTSIVLQRGEV